MANHHTREVPELSQEQRQELQRWLRRKKTGQALAPRARIVLESASGKSDQAVASALGTTRATVGKWRTRFLRDGCDGYWTSRVRERRARSRTRTWSGW